MSETIRIMCADIMGVVVCACCCVAFVSVIIAGIVCGIKWLKGEFKDENN